MMQATARKLDERPSGVLEDILYGARHASTRDAGDLGDILYRDPEQAREQEHRSFRLTRPRSLATLDELRDRMRAEHDDLGDEHRSFRLTASKRKKSTIYFYTKIHSKLKHAAHTLKRILPEDCRGRVSMSRVVNYALVLVLHDLDRRGGESLLARTMLENMRKGR